MTQHPEFFKAQTNSGVTYIARAHIIAVDVPNKSAVMGAESHKEPIVVRLSARGEVRIFSTENQREFLAWINTQPAYVPPVPVHPTWPGAL